MKPYTTITLPVNIEVDLSIINFIEFVFKKDLYDKCSALLDFRYNKSDLTKVVRTEAGVNGFIIDVRFSDEDTGKLPVGTVYMDTRLVTANGKVLPTEVVCLKVSPTLFEEAYGDG